MWQELYEEASVLLNDHSYPSYGSCVCALYSDNHHVYKAKSICSLEFKVSALKWAVLKMIEDGGTLPEKIVLLNELGEAILPSYEEMVLLEDFNDSNNTIEILVDEKKMIGQAACMFLPAWWGTCRLK